MSAVIKDSRDALAGLLAYVAQVRDRQLDEIRAASTADRRTLLGGARAKARAQVRQALREARHDADARIALARAGAQARLRRARQALTTAALAGVHERIDREMRRRWDEPASRAAWIAMAFAEATRQLPAGAWTVALPAGAALPDSMPLPAGVTLAARTDGAIAAGLRIACGAAELDASIAGLLRDRERIAAQWLGELERRREAR
jgi:hypothetical protein